MLDVPTHVFGRCTDEEILAEAAHTFPSSRIAMDLDRITV
jgi:ribonuclease Z